jgi:hypothetical protein
MFTLSDLVIESLIREGLQNIRNDLEIVDEVFEQLTTLPISPKYGEDELAKIKNFLTTTPISIVHSFHIVESNIPCISIQLLSANEVIDRAVLDDFADDITRDMTQDELNDEIVSSPILISGYDPLSGIVEIDDASDLSAVHINHILEDTEGNEFRILGGIDDTSGQKQVIIQKQAELDINGPALIKTMFDKVQFEQRTNVERETLLIGIHTKESKLTKYLYTLLKYIIESRKLDLIRRNFKLATYEGSDFTRDMNYGSDVVFTRFLTVTGEIRNDWNADKVVPIDLLELDVRVKKDIATNEQLGREDQTIKVTEDE